MSTSPPRPDSPLPAGKPTLPDLVATARVRPLVMVTAYDYPSARIAEEAGVDLILVGDSAATTVLGHDSTVPVTVDDLLVLTRAVTRGARRAVVVADLPYLSYTDDAEAIRNAGRFMKDAGADAVKLEGAGRMLDRIRALAGAGVPVVGHLGLTPQTASAQGGYRAQGRTARAALGVLHDARAIEAAGAFALVLEAVPPVVAEAVSDRLGIPTIGIGAGPGCDGQVLVWHDLLGLREGTPPRFVEAYADLRTAAVEAVGRYAADVRARRFPALRHTYTMPADELDAFEAALAPMNPVIE